MNPRDHNPSNGNANGVGAAGVAETEVLPPYVNPDPHLRVGQVEFSRAAIVNSPCFWILVGAGIMYAVSCHMNRRD